MKSCPGWVQGYNAQVVVTPQQILLAGEVSTKANDVRQLSPMLAKAQAMAELVVGEEEALGAAMADAGYWSEANAASETEDCELFIATRQDRRQRAELPDARSPRGRMPKGLSARQRMQRKLRTKRGRAVYALRGASVEPVFGQMKERRGAEQFTMRGLAACQGECTCTPPRTACASYTMRPSSAGQGTDKWHSDDGKAGKQELKRRGTATLTPPAPERTLQTIPGNSSRNGLFEGARCSP